MATILGDVQYTPVMGHLTTPNIGGPKAAWPARRLCVLFSRWMRSMISLKTWEANWSPARRRSLKSKPSWMMSIPGTFIHVFGNIYIYLDLRLYNNILVDYVVYHFLRYRATKSSP